MLVESEQHPLNYSEVLRYIPVFGSFRAFFIYSTTEDSVAPQKPTTGGSLAEIRSGFSEGRQTPLWYRI